MSSVSNARTLTIAAVGLAAGVVLYFGNRAPREDAGASHLRAPEPTPIAARPALLSPTDESSESPATATLRELDAMSETFRNTTFLIAIRDAGFLCAELLGVYGGVNDSATWTASCSQMLAYTVRVADDGALGIEPLLEHMDSLPFAPTRQPESEILLPPPQRQR
jgi:hypothetical protein